MDKKMNKSNLQILSRVSVGILILMGLAELALAMWTVFDDRYKSLAYHLADVGYIDLWILRYLSLCLFAASITTLVMCLILIWGLCSTHVFLFIASTMLVLVLIAEFTISMLTFANKYQTRLTLMEQLPKLVITYRQGTDERAKRALDILQFAFRCCGSDGRLSYQNNVPLSCNMFSIGCLPRTMYFLDTCMDSLAVVLLAFSLIKIFIILFFYVFLCYYQTHRSRTRKSTEDDSSIWRHSSSVDSSSMDNLPRKITGEYDYSPILAVRERMSQPSNEYNRTYQSSSPRKLSLIPERIETDPNEPSKPTEYITTIVRRTDPPVVPNRRKIIVRNVEPTDDDSGVERSSSERSLTDHRPKSKSPTSLSFSKVFVTSVSDVESIDTDVNRPLVPERISTPKSILKKPRTPSPNDPQRHPWSYTKTPPILHRIPKPNPRRNIFS